MKRTRMQILRIAPTSFQLHLPTGLVDCIKSQGGGKRKIFK